jgi:hypothetical protein
VAHQPSPAVIGSLIGVLGKETRHLALDRLRQ